MASLTKVRALPDLRILPAHGPVAPSSHARVDELLAFHEKRLALCLDSLGGGTALLGGRRPARSAGPGTRRRTTKLDEFAQGMAAMETKAHLDLLVARGEATREADADGVVWYSALAEPSRRIGMCGMPSSRYSAPATSKPKVAYQATSGAWRVEDDVLVRADLQRGLHQPVAPALAAHGRVQRDPADPPGVARRRRTRAQPSTTPCSSSSTTCRVSGRRSRPSRSWKRQSCSRTNTSWRSFHRL